jgi:hypothetical protein
MHRKPESKREVWQLKQEGRVNNPRAESKLSTAIFVFLDSPGYVGEKVTSRIVYFCLWT